MLERRNVVVSLGLVVVERQLIPEPFLDTDTALFFFCFRTCALKDSRGTTAAAVLVPRVALDLAENLARSWRKNLEALGTLCDLVSFEFGLRILLCV